METTRRNSKKRQAIYDALCSTTTHPSAEQLYRKLKPEFPDLSLGTVYRNLGLLADNGQIVRIGSVAGETRYDANTSRHAHFICTECGAVEDLMLPLDLESRFPEISRCIGAEVSDYSTVFYGRCKNCVR